MFLHIEWNLLCFNTDMDALMYIKAFKYIH
jgi:hypothetical protein